MFHRAPYFTNVNEEGEAYEEHTDYESALATLHQYPNDHIVVRLERREGPRDGNDPVTGIAYNN